MVITGTTIALGVLLLAGIVGISALAWIGNQYFKNQQNKPTSLEGRTASRETMSTAVAFSEQPAPSGTAKTLQEQHSIDTYSSDSSHDIRGLHTPSGHAHRNRRF